MTRPYALAPRAHARRINVRACLALDDWSLAKKGSPGTEPATPRRRFNRVSDRSAIDRTDTFFVSKEMKKKEN